MIPKFKLPGRRASSESVKPLSYSLDNMSRDGAPLPVSRRPPVTRPSTPIHRVLRFILPFSRNFTLPLPVALLAVIIFVHISTVMPNWVEANAGKGGPTTDTWAPSWIVFSFSFVYIAWWYVVWANNRKARRHGRPFLTRLVHVCTESFLLVANIICLAFMAILAPRRELQFEVGFPYVATLAALFGMQLIFVSGTLVGLLYECRMEMAYPASGTNHV